MIKAQIAKLVKVKFDIDLDVNSFKRTYAGYWQRSSGAWSWYMFIQGGTFEVGSSYSITELLKNKNNVYLENGDELIISNETTI